MTFPFYLEQAKAARPSSSQRVRPMQSMASERDSLRWCWKRWEILHP